MANADKVGAPEEESNIDQINQFVTSSDKNPEDVSDKNSKKVDQDKDIDTEEQSETKIETNESKTVEKAEPEKKIERLVHHKPAKQKEIKKPEVKKVEVIHKKEEHKPVQEIEHKKIPEKEVKHKDDKKPVVKKIVKEIKETPKVKKTNNNTNNNVRKPAKEEKMVTHKEHKERKEHKSKFKFTKNTLMWISIGVLVVILVTALVLILSPGKHQQPVTIKTNNTVAATVNGEPIYLQDVQKEYDALSPVYKAAYTTESILNKSIDDMLLAQEAKNRDITATAAEVQSEIDAIKIQNQLTDTAFENALEQQGLTLDGVKAVIEKNIVIRKLLNETVLKDITVTDAEIEAYYNLNKDKFKVPDRVTVQHILILVTPNVTNETAKAKIEMIQKELNATNFCDLVTKYSEDPGSLSTCGKYTFAKGDFQNPEFENPSFDLGINETAIVKTVFGYHLIKKLETIPAGVQSLANVSETIRTTLHDETAQKKFDALLIDLRAKASIINYMTKTDTNATVLTPAKNLDDFAKCITAKNTSFYGASWCPHCQNQKDMFGSSLQYVQYVECAVEGQPQVQTKECTAAGISGYPTWVINGKQYPGEQTIEGLAKLTGCAAPQ